MSSNAHLQECGSRCYVICKVLLIWCWWWSRSKLQKCKDKAVEKQDGRETMTTRYCRCNYRQQRRIRETTTTTTSGIRCSIHSSIQTGCVLFFFNFKACLDHVYETAVLEWDDDMLHLASNCTTNIPRQSTCSSSLLLLVHSLRFWRFLNMILHPHSVHRMGSVGEVGLKRVSYGALIDYSISLSLFALLPMDYIPIP